MLHEMTTPEPVTTSGVQKQLLRCPKCRQQTKRIEVELESHDWGRLWILGIWAVFSPGKDHALVCEHCGNIFERREVQSRTANRLIGFALLFISIAAILAVVVLLAAGMIKYR